MKSLELRPCEVFCQLPVLWPLTQHFTRFNIALIISCLLPKYCASIKLQYINTYMVSKFSHFSCKSAAKFRKVISCQKVWDCQRNFSFFELFYLQQAIETVSCIFITFQKLLWFITINQIHLYVCHLCLSVINLHNITYSLLIWPYSHPGWSWGNQAFIKTLSGLKVSWHHDWSGVFVRKH